MKEKILIKESNNYSSMKAKKFQPLCPSSRGQVAIEHLTVTAVILAMVTIAFAFGFVTFDQNIKIAKARDALTALTGTANDIYTLGKGNARFVDVSFPAGMKSITITHACCTNPSDAPPCTTKAITATETECTDAGGEVEFSLIEITVSLLGGDTTISRESKAEIADASTFPSVNEAAGGPPYAFRVSWTDDGEKIKLQKV